MVALDLPKPMSRIVWKNVNINASQIEAIEKLLADPNLGKFGFKSIPDFISKAITFYITYLEEQS